MLDSLLSVAANADALEAGGLVALGLVFFVAALIFVPRPPVCILGGLVFGLPAFPVALVGYTCGAALAFLLARYLLRTRFAAFAARRPRLKLIVEAVNAEGWRLVALLRLGSPIPGSAANYLFGLTHIGLGPYMAATFVGSVPQGFAFFYLGATGRMALQAETVSAVQAAFALAGCAVLLCVIYLVSRRVRSMLAATLARQAAAGSATPAPSLAHAVPRDGNSRQRFR